MSISGRTKGLIVAVVVIKALALGGFGYAEGWFGGWFGGAKPAAVAPATAPAAPGGVAATSPTAAVDLGPLPSRAEALQLQGDDRVLGRFGAPLTIIEYASMTCHHCAKFKTDTMPAVKRDWIETGKAVYVLRDLPWDNLALGMSAVARCVPPHQFYPMADALFAAQATIVQGNPLEGINAVAAQAGLNDEAVQECIRRPDLQQQITRSKQIALTVLGVKGTPTIFVNGALVDGAVSYASLKETLEAEYAKATSAK